MEPRGSRRAAVVYTAALLRRVEHPLIRWVREAEEVLVETGEGSGAEAEEGEYIKELIQLALEWVDGSKEGD